MMTEPTTLRFKYCRPKGAKSFMVEIQLLHSNQVKTKDSSDNSGIIFSFFPQLWQSCFDVKCGCANKTSGVVVQ